MTKKILSIAGVLILVLALLGGGFLLGKSTFLSTPAETVTETETSEVIHAVQRRQEIVLLSTSTQGLHTTQNSAKLFKWVSPEAKN